MGRFTPIIRRDPQGREDSGQVQRQRDRGITADPEICEKTQRHLPRGRRQMIGKTALSQPHPRRLRGAGRGRRGPLDRTLRKPSGDRRGPRCCLRPKSLDREKYIPTLPTPVQTIHQRIKRMPRRPATRITAVNIGGQTDVQFESDKISGRHALPRARLPATPRIEKAILPVQLHPATVSPQQDEARKKCGQPGDP